MCGDIGMRGASIGRRRAGALAIAILVAACGDGGSSGPTPPPPPTLPIAVPASSQGCTTGTAPSGALVELCLPALWNGRVILWAHGFVNPGPERPPGTLLALPEDEAGGLSVREIALGVGTAGEGFYGYAATSYRRNGLVAAEAVEDVGELTDWIEGQLASFAASRGFASLPLGHLLIGASEGGLTTALALEVGGPEALDGGLALCGPIGDFRRQLDWLGDFRVLFDHYVPEVMPGDAVSIPAGEISEARWSTLQTEIRTAMAGAPADVAALMSVAGVPLDPRDPDAPRSVAIDLLRYSFFATNDAIAELGGNPFDNATRAYAGSPDDAALNAAVDRFTADAPALAALDAYETTGRLRAPLVTLHTAGDPIVPAWHLTVHAGRVASAGAGALLDAFPATDGFGHCGFALADVLAAFSSLVERTTASPMIASASLFSSTREREEFLRRAARTGTSPQISGARPPPSSRSP